MLIKNCASESLCYVKPLGELRAPTLGTGRERRSFLSYLGHLFRNATGLSQL
jgi:hypothetical protein